MNKPSKIKLLMGTLLERDVEIINEALGQARQETAREIFEEIGEHRVSSPFVPVAADGDRTIFKENKWYRELKSKYGMR